MYDLSGKVALVTGAGGERGFGRAIAMRLAQEGADIIVNDIVQNPYAGPSSGWRGLDSVVQKIKALGRRALSIIADVSDSAQVEKMVREGIRAIRSYRYSGQQRRLEPRTRSRSGRRFARGCLGFDHAGESQRSISLLPVRGARNDPAKIRRQNNHHVVRGWKARAGLSGRLCGV